MLSKSHTLKNIKKEIEDFDIYGYESENRNGYQDVPLATAIESEASGLSVNTQYYFKINGIEYDITTGTDLTYADIIVLINAEIIVSFWCVFELSISSGVNGLRFISDTAGSASNIVLLAGTTGLDLFSSLDNWSDFNTAIAGNDNSFDADLVLMTENVEREQMVPVISSSTYTTIEALDKIGLSTAYENIYMAEIFYCIAEFFKFNAKKDKYLRRGQGENRSEGKVSYSSSGMTGKDWAAFDYIKKAEKCLSLGGYGVSQRLQRKASIYGD